jgi:hypothetical protein
LIRSFRCVVLRAALHRAAAVLLAAVTPLPAVAQTAAPAASAASAPAAALRPEVAKLLRPAQEMIVAGQYKEALAKIAEAQALPDLTPYEAMIANRLKAPAAFGAGDKPLALASLEGALESPAFPAADRLAVTETTVKLARELGDFPRALRWLERYLREGGKDPGLRALYPQLLRATGDHAGAIREVKALIAADEVAGRPTPENLLRTMAASANAIGDQASYQLALEQLAVTTGQPDYWADLISRVSARPGFAEERLRLDVYRLMQQVGVDLGGDEYVDLAERAQQVGQPIEALAALDAASAKGLLAKIKNQAALQKLRDQVAKAAAQDRSSFDESERSARAAKDGDPLVSLGLAVLSAGAADRAVGLMQQGIAKGGLRRPDEAQLWLGMALTRAGHPDEARRAFAAVTGSDGTADLARLWTLYLKSKPAK